MVIVSDQINIELNREEVCRCLGYSDNRNPSRKILELIDEYLENAYNLIEPSYLHVVRDIEWVQDSCVLVGGPDDSHSHDVVFEGNVVSELLEQCHKVGVFVVTIGQYLEDTVFELTNKGHVLQAIVLDAIGSSAVEKVADFARGLAVVSSE